MCQPGLLICAIMFVLGGGGNVHNVFDHGTLFPIRQSQNRDASQLQCDNRMFIAIIFRINV